MWREKKRPDCKLRCNTHVFIIFANRPTRQSGWGGGEGRTKLCKHRSDTKGGGGGGGGRGGEKIGPDCAG